MKVFETSVAIGCDLNPDTIKDARAIRAVLEAYGFRVHLYELSRKRDALLFLAGEIAACGYVVLCCHGGERPGTIDLQVIDQQEGNYECPDRWEKITLSLTPESVPGCVRGVGRTLICNACNAGSEPLAQAFLASGYKGYVASSRAVFGPAGVLFVIGFFYHLLTSTRIDSDPTNYSQEEAAALAAKLDAEFHRGTLPFRYFGGPGGKD